MSKQKSVRLGVIGIGNMGLNHVRSIQGGKVPGLEVTAVADQSEARAKQVEGVAHFTDPQKLIQSGKVDAVLIATPHFDHKPLGIAALENGIHVLVEKPISVHKRDCEDLIKAYDPKSKLVFAAMFNLRTEPYYRKVKELLDKKVLGKILRINWIITDWFRSEHYYKSGDWRATWGGEGGGVLLNQCPHQLDLWQWFFGMPQSVYARCQMGRFHDIEVEDSVTAILEYEGGVQGVFITTTGEAPGTNRLEVAGEHGRLVLENRKITFLRNEESCLEFSKTTKSAFGSPPFWIAEIPSATAGEQHVAIMKNFTAAIQGQEELVAPAVDGIHSVELGNAMLLSTFQNRQVELPLSSEEFAAELHKRIETSRFKGGNVSAAPVADDFSKSF